MNEPITTVRYLTDDRDTENRHELCITQGGNGDWYVAVVPEGDAPIRGVRICTSGGAACAVPGLGVAIAEAFRAMLEATRPPKEKPRFENFAERKGWEVVDIEVDSHLLASVPEGYQWVPNPTYETAPYELGKDGHLRLRDGFDDPLLTHKQRKLYRA